MEPNENDLMSPSAEPTEKPARHPSERSVPLRVLLVAVCVAIVTSVLFTYTFTAFAKRREYTQRLAEQQAVIDSLRGDGSPSARNMALLDALLEYYAYYSEEMDREAMMTAAFKAYLEASGDRYAEYYSEEEYQALQASSNGNYGGIGVTVINDTVEINGATHKVFRVARIYEGAPALAAGIAVGDLICAVQRDGVWKTVNELNYTGAEGAIVGEAGTQVRLRAYRVTAEAYMIQEFEVLRQQVQTPTVTGTLSAADASVGIVRIEKFNRNTPTQFKEQMQRLLEENVRSFVFDVRGNPGGDLRSILAILSYFLQEGDLVLEAKDKSGNVAERHVVAPCAYTGEYAECSVDAKEIGMYADIEMAILCDNNTASAAEVFVAALRDHREIRNLKLRAIVGEKTFGKGIMQTTRRVSFEDTVGYVKLTTHAYVTRCGVSYHEKGIEPTEGDTVALSEEARKYPVSVLPQELDTQLQMAVARLQNR